MLNVTLECSKTKKKNILDVMFNFEMKTSGIVISNLYLCVHMLTTLKDSPY